MYSLSKKKQQKKNNKNPQKKQKNSLINFNTNHRREMKLIPNEIAKFTT